MSSPTLSIRAGSIIIGDNPAKGRFIMLRFATPDDAAALLAIYAPYIETSVTFEYVVPSLEEFRGRIETISGDYPYLVWEEDGVILGYAYAHRHMERAAYQWNAELSVYLDESACGRGLGTRLYAALMELLRLQGIRNVFGCVTLPNERSEALHRAMGFALAGTYSMAGYKNGRWHDVGWFQKAIAAYDDPPAPLVSFRDVDAAAASAIMARHSE